MKRNIEKGKKQACLGWAVGRGGAGRGGAGDVIKRNRVGKAGSVGVEDISVPRNET
jgi:hypothetical protein